MTLVAQGLNNRLILEMDLCIGSANHIRFLCFLACLQRNIATVHLLALPVCGFLAFAAMQLRSPSFRDGMWLRVTGDW